ncbi:uncharacterized protein LOC134233602 [Saccostrea cucullata]|uniref:uncharacterized protein LOC134233602 n=1 Tax=Saccostrea cuccullata TaxID=36930 RepID=UPI002ED66924
MHSNAPRLSSPRGSRLEAQNGALAPTPDSPGWVCTPVRVPGHDDGFKPSPAGQTQLDTSRMEETSSTLEKDVGYKDSIQTVFSRVLNESYKDSTQTVSSCVVDGNFTGYNEKQENKNVNVDERKEKKNKDISHGNQENRKSENMYERKENNNIKNIYDKEKENLANVNERGENATLECVQGSFHQGDPIFGDNAGTQCVANCLAGLSYHKVKDKELPQFYECFDGSFEFRAIETLSSVILSNSEFNFAEFGAFSLDEALHIALAETDGCFVCFGGNTLLIGKSENGFFTYDSHSRSSKGLLSVNGKSTRVLFGDVAQLCFHLRSLAISMGYSKDVECNVTGVHCKVENIINATYNVTQTLDHVVEEAVQNPCTSQEISSDSETSELDFVSLEQEHFYFNPLDFDMKREICQELNIPFICSGHGIECHSSGKILEAPSSQHEVYEDGNCFFRAISFILTNSEDYHYIIRSAVCKHLLENEAAFKPFLRTGENTVEDHLSVSSMVQNGKWATELEILAVCHMINGDIYTYTRNHWLKYSFEKESPLMKRRNGAMYLNHQSQNHYNVVLDVHGENVEMTMETLCENKTFDLNYMKKKKNRQRMQAARQDSASVMQRRNIVENIKNRERYRKDALYRSKTQLKSKTRYAENEESRRKSKDASMKKYSLNEAHKENVKQRSAKKYRDNKEYREAVKKRGKEKYKNDEMYRENMKQRNLEKFKTDEKYRRQIDCTRRYWTNKHFRKKILSTKAKRYSTDDRFRSTIKACSKKQYSSNPDLKVSKRKSIQHNRETKLEKLKHEKRVIEQLKEKSLEGIDYVCCCCHRLLFVNQVQKCDRQIYCKDELVRNVSNLCLQEIYFHKCTDSCPDGCTRSTLWICYTCHRKIMSGNIPAEAVYNEMHLEDIPEELTNMNNLEQHLIALHIPFMKVMALPHGGQRNIHGPVVCVPSDLKKTSSLPLNQGENLLLRVKLKRKLSYKGYFEYQFVNPNQISAALNYLKLNNQWYKDVKINENWTENTNENEETSEEIHDMATTNDNDEPQQIAIDTCLQPVDIAQEVLDHYFDDIYNIAPGEGKNQVRMLQDPGNEAKAFPCHFPSGKFTWNEERGTRITLSRYFNNRLMNADDRFAKDSNYIFFSQFMSELNQVIEKTQISVRKSFSKMGNEKIVTSSMVQDPEILSRLLKNDEAVRFMQPIRGTPAYWSSAQKDLFAMLRQLGIPTWFCSFSAAEHRWNDAVRTILRQQNDERDPCMLDWSEKNETLRKNPVTVARMFEHRFHVFQGDVIFSPSEPIGKVVDFFQRVEFQQRGSPHMHCLYWVENAPKLEEHGKEAVCDFIDRYVTCELPSETEDPELRNIVLAVQQHSRKHSKSCRKKGTECRFNFPRPPSSRTFISSPCDDDDTKDDDVTTNTKLMKSGAKDILLRVWEEVQNNSNACRSTEDIFNDLSLSQDQYEEAHNMLSKSKSIILQRNPGALWINQYNPCLLKCWDANMDIQFVLDPFSCIVYIISYISKSEREMGMLLKQTKIEAEEGNLDAGDTMKKIGSAYLHHREVSAQEAVYRVCNLKMKECSRKVVFVPVGKTQPV